MSLHIAKVAIPTILGQVFALLVVSANTAYIGQVGDEFMIAGVGLGTLYVNIFCQSIILGLNGALQTLVSQSFGAGNIRECGIILNRGRIVAFLAFIPIVIILCLCEPFMLAVGMDPIASDYASTYTYFLIPAMFFHSQFDATRQYLNSQNKAQMVMYTMIVTSMLHFVWCELFVMRWGWDVYGISLATIITYFSNFAAITLYCLWDKEVKRSFFWFTKESY